MVENPICSYFVLMMNPISFRSLGARAYPGSRCNGRESFWRARRATGQELLPLNCDVMKPRCGGPANGTEPKEWRDYSPMAAKNNRGDTPRFPPLQKAQIVELACLEPVATGLHITHWSSEDLARQAVAQGIAPAISSRTVRRILDDVDLQPHRTRYWRTSRLDACFKQRAEKVLWCYAQAVKLARRGVWVVCADEMPSRQVLERRPVRRAIPGSIEQLEFEYARHGTVNILTFLIVHSGRMEATCLETNDAASYTAALRRFRRTHRHLNGVYLIHDGGSSHTAALTCSYLAGLHDWWKPRRTPVHASWLDQAELLNHAFDMRYLKRGSWKSREEYIAHVMESWPEYNRLYAHPFEWTWTNQKMRRWYAEHAK